jgi:hypothetical protein
VPAERRHRLPARRRRRRFDVRQVHPMRLGIGRVEAECCVRFEPTRFLVVSGSFSFSWVNF